MSRQMIHWQKPRNWRSAAFGTKILLKALALSCMALLFAGIARAQVPGGTAHHEATLTWNQDAGATGFNVYRALTPTGPFSIVSVTPVPEPPSTSQTLPSFVDVNVVQGGTYSWCVTALATISTGTFESACSSVVTASIPKDPVPTPGGLGVVTQ
jgi:hypothetical protein